jgi:hypothetical protein
LAFFLLPRSQALGISWSISEKRLSALTMNRMLPVFVRLFGFVPVFGLGTLTRQPSRHDSHDRSMATKVSLIKASCARSANPIWTNSSEARENVDSEGSLLKIGKPQIRRNERSTLSRSRRLLVSLIPSAELATVRQPGPLIRRTPRARVPGRTEFLDARPFRRMDNALQFRRQHSFVPESRHQLMLDNMPTLQQKFAAGSIHGRAE